MMVMPSNASGWLWHCLARETGKIGHLFSPGGQRGPWPWFPYALDNGVFACWNMENNSFDFDKWKTIELKWKHLLVWSASNNQKPLWAIVPDVPGNAEDTLLQWKDYACVVQEFNIPLALAVQDGMSPDMVRGLHPKPDVICVGGTTKWKWDTIEMWASEFDRVHLLRCNSPSKIQWLDDIGVESCDGTGWNRGDRHIRTKFLEEWCRKTGKLNCNHPLWIHASKKQCKRQLTFA